MRITSSMTNRRYVSAFNRNSTELNKTFTRMMSGRQYSRAGENPVAAARAMRIRKQMSDTNAYMTNLNTAATIYDVAETQVRFVSEKVQDVYQQLIRAAHGTNGEQEDDILANQLDQFAEAMVKAMNVKIGDRYVFGGVNDSTNPFSITSGGTVMYNGKSVDSYQDFSLFPFSEESFADIGVGMKLLANGQIDPDSALKVTFNGAEVLGCGNSGKMNMIDLNSMVDGEQYSFDVTIGSNQITRVVFTAGATPDDTANAFNAAISPRLIDAGYASDAIQINSSTQLFESKISIKGGSGAVTIENTYDASSLPAGFSNADIEVNPIGYTTNIIQLVKDAANAVRSHNKVEMARYADVLYETQANVLMTITNIGTTGQFIEFNQDRFTTLQASLDEQQNMYEFTDYSTESTNFASMQALYNASLQLTSKLTPMSIFNFIN